jgi:hypothetical protein
VMSPKDQRGMALLIILCEFWIHLGIGCCINLSIRADLIQGVPVSSQTLGDMLQELDLVVLGRTCIG